MAAGSCETVVLERLLRSQATTPVAPTATAPAIPTGSSRELSAPGLSGGLGVPEGFVVPADWDEAGLDLLFNATFVLSSRRLKEAVAATCCVTTTVVSTVLQPPAPHRVCPGWYVATVVARISTRKIDLKRRSFVLSKLNCSERPMRAVVIASGDGVCVVKD